MIVAEFGAPPRSVTATIPGAPVGQARGRAGAIYRKGPGGPVPVMTKTGRVIVNVHDPIKSRNWKATAQAHYAAALGDRSPLEGPIVVVVESIFALPVSGYRKRDPRKREWNQGQKDVDNLAKAALDAANGVLWKDDREVAILVSFKVTAAQDELPGVRVTATEIRGQLSPAQTFALAQVSP